MESKFMPVLRDYYTFTDTLHSLPLSLCLFPMLNSTFQQLLDCPKIKNELSDQSPSDSD